jgi:putative peptidoglycan lipid II flippase
MKAWKLQKIIAPWKRFTSGSTNRKIFGSAIMVVLITSVVKIAAIYRELLVAWTFGTKDALDAFLIALVVPAFVINVVVGSFGAALIPTYIQVREQEGKIAAQKLFSGATIWNLGILGITTAVVLVTAPLYLPKMTAGFSAEKLDLTFKLLYAIAPVIALSGLIAMWGGVLNAGERFALTAITPIITPVISIAFLTQAHSWGAFTLATGLVCGTFVEMFIVGFALHRQGISLIPKWYGFEPNLRQVVNQYSPTIVGACLMCSATLVDDSMAATLSPGSVAALNYGTKLTLLPINLAVIALRTVITPYFSKMVVHQDWKGIRHTIKRYLIIIFGVSLPLITFIIICSEVIIRTLLQRGSFNLNDTHIVSQIQICSSLQIPFYIGNILLLNLITSLQKNYILIQLSALNLFINITLNYLLMQWIGIKGIALSTSILYMFSFSYLLIFIIRKLPKGNLPPLSS